MEKVILVDTKDTPIGWKEKIAAHRGKGMLHRAFSVLVFNRKGELLIQKRSKEKMLWPGYWSNTCCSHPRKGEEIMKAARRRLKEELGFTCDLTFITKFRYTARYKHIGSEREVCSILVGKYNGSIKPNPKEVQEIKWISLPALKMDIKRNPRQYTPWFKIELRKLYAKSRR